MRVAKKPTKSVALATVANNPALVHFLAVMYASIALSHNKKLPDSVLDSLENEWHNKSLDFIEEYNFDKKKYKRFINVLLDQEHSKLNQVFANWGDILRDKIRDIQQDHNITGDQLALLKDVSLWFRSNSEPAQKRLWTKVPTLGIPGLAGLFIAKMEKVNQEPLIKKLQAIVKKLVGRTDTRLTLKEAKQFPKDSPRRIQYEAYLKLRRDTLNVAKGFLLHLVRNSGQPFLPLNVVRQEFKKAGVTEHTLPEEYSGEIGEKGELYKDGLKLQGAIGPDYKAVMNKEYNSKKDCNYVCKAVPKDPDSGMREQYVYTSSFIKRKRIGEKQENITEFIKNIDKIRTKWLKHMNSKSITKNTILALMLEIIFLTACRVGSENGATKVLNKETGETTTEKTFGLSTWRLKHIKLLKNGGIKILYKGKKHVEQTHIIKLKDNEQSIKLIKELLKDKKADSHVFTYNKKPITAIDVNAYLKNLGVNKGIHVHSLRTAKSCILMSEQLKTKDLTPKSMDQKSVDSMVRSMIENVALELGHRTTTPSGELKLAWQTSGRSYISTSLTKSIYDKTQTRYPSWLNSWMGLK